MRSVFYIEMCDTDIEKPIRILFNKYNISTNDLHNICIEPKVIAALAHISHQYEEIVAASLFGSRTDENKIVTEDSDIDFLIKLEQLQNWDKICYYIIRDLNKVLDKEDVDNIDISVFNGQHKDKKFKKTAREQSFMIKGYKKNLCN